MLTRYQRMVAMAPYHYPIEDVMGVMELLGGDGRKDEFGDETWAVIFSLHQASLARNIPVPSNFALLMQRVENNPSEYSWASTWDPPRIPGRGLS